ncbi:MAG TPA: FAD-dependent oxidoreductase [Polyangiaceae bacterium]|nr:FAD-dependent oxidoreductase [Polyangiaceae bacterium]
MSVPQVLVVGGGFSGVAAAVAARRAGAEVTLIHAQPGASALYSGIVDGQLLEPPISALAEHLGCSVSQHQPVIATFEGSVRAARAHDCELLDLSPLAGRKVGVLDLARDDWDAQALVACYASSAWARATATQFLLLKTPGLSGITPASVLQHASERQIPAYDFALLLEQPARQQRLIEEIGRASLQPDAFLGGPWLGLSCGVARRLSTQLGSRAIGESSGPPGGVAGARFENRRSSLLRQLGIREHRSRVDRVAPAGSRLRVSAKSEEVEVDAVVLALGGVAVGGVVLEPSSRGFRLSVEAPGGIELDGEELDAASAAFGVSFSRLGLSALQRVGVRTSQNQRIAAELALFACGDVAAGRSRSVSEALSSGYRAGLHAAAAAQRPPAAS